MSNKTTAVLVVIAIIIIAGVVVVTSRKAPAPMPTDASDTSGMTGMDMDGSSPDTTGTTPAATDDTTNPAPASDASSTVKSFTVDGSNFKFAPSTLAVNKGDTVNITFTNSGGMHDFKIDEFNVATPRIEDGQSATVTFVADKTGTFQYYCSVGDHRAMGMWGTLTVS